MIALLIILVWAGFAATVGLILMPADLAVGAQLTVRILLAAIAAMLAFFIVDDRYFENEALEWFLKLLAGAVGASLFLFFDLYPEIVQAGIAVLVAISAFWVTFELIDEIKDQGDTRFRFVRLVQALLVLTWIGFVGGIVYSLAIEELKSFALASGVLLLGSSALCFAAFTISAMAEGRPFQVESHWGGLGGGLGGWRISQPIILLILTLVFTGGAAAVVMKALPKTGDQTTESQNNESNSGLENPLEAGEAHAAGEESTDGEASAGDSLPELPADEQAAAEAEAE